MVIGKQVEDVMTKDVVTAGPGTDSRWRRKAELLTITASTLNSRRFGSAQPSMEARPKGWRNT
jgi:hypothetical protein